jgi:hypothetical protein
MYLMLVVDHLQEPVVQVSNHGDVEAAALRQLYRQYEDIKPIAFAEMAAALACLIWATRDLQQPRNITLYNDSSIVYYSLARGTGLTLRRSVLLQNLYIGWLFNKVKSGHGLVVRWLARRKTWRIPSPEACSPKNRLFK